ncbi:MULTISPECIES: aminotransferase class V-fold PLP-dependent enzyme [unclassified Oceanobacter]|uniref:aminotransferase class V-fold PLP-dependent enzyme n=1 Tax=unclassified Oceanobacter TaxID=2620260 RepID=UPI0026E12E31|nr:MULTISPECIES: aminotransferase class V-fold PLP-dependent enzyme [unclassified Oceanobacter]MDO6682561.1 aminotransferase class V-fold PLP-dependent enzyme [Oceanobacter sp. 5_MG-2023]MDP2506777.1 aminotransferase class V-fold PLP-dependent enzyme [Oceanobacter sp. 3_MG-2023]MDP2547914.1 aminotransferase class V-fold PLP-dependent enzyme [Oceanobacter sp. 4_MG-2023]
MKTLYLDYAATTPVDPAVAEAMTACLTMDGNFANPASRSHRFGWQAEQAVEKARRQVADVLGAEPREIVWTSGATESNNLALKGVVEYYRRHHPGKSCHIISSAIEHKAILDTLAWLKQQDVAITLLTPDADGLIQPQQVADALRDDTVLVSLMAVNNEIGTLTDIAAVAEQLSDHPALLHVDAAQAVGKLPVNVNHWRVDLLSVSAHKFYGPKGIGVLYVRRQPQVHIDAQIHGGGHERGMRSGTLPTHQIVGIGTAAQMAATLLAEELPRITALRERLQQALLELGDVYLNGHAQQRVAGLLNLSFDGVDGEILLASLAQVAVSSGSACTSASIEPSYVLKAIGRSNALAHAGLRFSVGRYTTEDDIDFAIEQVSRIVTRLRQQTSRG